MKKYIMISIPLIVLSACIFAYTHNQTTSSKTTPSNSTEESTQSTTAPTNLQPSQEPSQTQAPLAQSQTADLAEPVNCLTKEEQKYNQIISNNMIQFQELAKQFCQQSDTTQSEELLMASFLRCGEERYTNRAWSKLAGDCEEFTQFIEKADY
ncbi:MAG: hypothetical protein PHY47_19695, partial [Lachnospiraceae bacterium]|nr:hypothetical protein [Lachnospiraceae bacterium]